MDLWQLHIFCKVVELASFSKAGQTVHLSQPTVSSHIKDLEQHFGCPLINRLARRAVPTKAGELLHTHALRILALRDETETVMAEFLGHYKGRLVIGGSTIPGGYLLPKMIGRFNNVYPNIRISLIISDSREIVQKTLAGEIEMGVVGAHFSDSHLCETALASDTMKLIVARQHPWAGQSSIALDDLRQEPLIVRESGSGTRQVLERAIATKGLRLHDAFHIVAEIGNTAGVISGIKSGLGVSVLSTMAVEDDLTHQTLAALDISGIDLQRNFYLVSDQRRAFSPLAHAFQTFITTHPISDA
jgi:DNA-binding transcriptional LysR family regulator